MDLGLKGAAAVVTGGSKGMGLATARSLAGEGARVAVLARGRQSLDETTTEVLLPDTIHDGTPSQHVPWIRDPFGQRRAPTALVVRLGDRQFAGQTGNAIRRGG